MPDRIRVCAALVFLVVGNYVMHHLLVSAHRFTFFCAMVVFDFGAIISVTVIGATALEWHRERRDRQLIAAALEWENPPEMLERIIKSMPLVPADTASEIVRRRPSWSQLVDEAIRRGADGDAAFRTACAYSGWSAGIVDHMMATRPSVPEDTICLLIEAAFGQRKHKDPRKTPHDTALYERLQVAARLGAAYDTSGRYPPIYYALRLADPHLVKMLIERGARLDRALGSCWDSKTALEWAIATHNDEIFQAVLRAVPI